MKSKIFLIVIVLLFSSYSSGYCASNIPNTGIISKFKNHCPQLTPSKNYSEENYIQNQACNNDTAEIKSLFNKQKTYLNTSNIEELKKLYSENYLSNDGFDKETLFKLYEDTLKNHPDIKYDIYITKLTVEGCYATVRAINKSTATTAEKSQITGDNGLLTIDMETVFYLKKTGNEWQIFAEQTTSEKTSLLYGDCKNSGIELFAPECIASNTDYTAILKLPVKYSQYAMGSIKKDPIIFPSPQTPDIFKAFDSIGVIERIFKSNTKGNNETVAASVVFALPKTDKYNTIDIKISGLGVLLQRVNVITPPQK